MVLFIGIYESNPLFINLILIWTLLTRFSSFISVKASHYIPTAIFYASFRTKQYHMKIYRTNNCTDFFIMLINSCITVIRCSVIILFTGFYLNNKSKNYFSYTANPKSPNFATWFLNKIFSGLMSRCIICICFILNNAFAIWYPNNLTTYYDNPFSVYLNNLYKSPP